jgi:hypothetical protein
VSIDRPPWEGVAPVDPSPFEETHDLRHGPDLHPALLGLLPYVGVWRGRGRGGYPTIEDYTYAQEVRFSHDGRPFLAYESRAWILDDEDKPVRPSHREVGWWRGAQDSDEIEALIVAPTGVMELYLGKVDGLKVEMVTDAVVRTATAKDVTASQRLYGIVEGGDLAYVDERAMEGQELQPHLSARLSRIAG